MSDKAGRLIAFRNDRLGARLISLVNAVRMSRAYHIPFAVHWPEAIDIGHVFNDPTELFDHSFVQQHFIGPEEWRTCRGSAERIGAVIPRGGHRLTKLSQVGRDILVDQAFNITVLHEEDEAEVRQAFAKALDQVPLAEPLRKPADALKGLLAGATAYHIRRGDLTDGLKAMNKAWPHKFVPDEFYRHHMERELTGNGRRVIVFSDDPRTIERFRQTFPSISTVDALVDLSELTPGARDLLELYAMSRCAKIIAPDRSAFSSTAADLGGAVKIDVISDMDEALRLTAHDSLVARLREAPNSFSGDGEVAQSLAHAIPHIVRSEGEAAAATLVRHLIRQGLNISFLYPQLMALQHKSGDVAGVLETARFMDARYVLHTRDYAVAETWRGYALIRAGEDDAGLRHMANAFWHDPGRAEVKSALGYLVDTERLGPGNFLPVDREFLSMRRRRGTVGMLTDHFPELIPDGADVASLPALDLLAWDWDPLMRSQMTPAAVRKGLVAGFRDLLAKVSQSDKMDQATAASMDALLVGHMGDLAKARSRLAEISTAAPNHAMAAQRLSHICWLMRDFRGAAAAGEHAATLAPDVPALLAWAGMTMSRSRNWQGARDHLTAADAADTGFASIPAMLAESLDRVGEPDAALEAGKRAITLAPTEPRFKMAQAKRLTARGDKEAAAAEFHDIFTWERAPQRAHAIYAELLIDLNRVGDAATIVAKGLTRNPENERLVELRKELSQVRPQAATG